MENEFLGSANEGHDVWVANVSIIGVGNKVYKPTDVKEPV